MRHFAGNQTVDPGMYFNLRRLQFRNVDHAGPLPGTAEDTFHLVPTPLLLIVGPLLGLVFVIFLPLIGFGAVGWLLGRQAFRAIRRLFRRTEKPTN